MRTAYLEVLRNLTFKAIKLETRLSDRQVAQLRWSQIHGNVIRTTRMRDCEVSREVINALALLPHKDSGVDFVFFGNSLSVTDLEALRIQQEAKERPRRHLLMWNLKKVA